MNSNEQIISEISTRIHSLELKSGDSLRTEMQELKKSLIENPAACALMLPEDIGLMVVALRKIVGTAIATASSKAKKPKDPSAAPAKAKKMTAEELKAALEDEDF